MVGLVTSDELVELETKKESSKLRRTPSATSKSTRASAKTSAGEYSTRTGRWNETPRVLSRSRSFNRRTPLSSIVPDHLFCVDEQEREIWVGTVLTRIECLYKRQHLFIFLSSSCFKFSVKFCKQMIWLKFSHG